MGDDFLLRLLFRPLLVFVTLVVIVVALLQVGGRVAVSVLAQAEPTINRLLAGRQVRVVGLSGDWRLLNPIVRIGRIELPAGRLDGVIVEFDTLESLFRNHVVARRVRVRDAALRLEQGQGGWRLAGSGPGAGFDAWPLLRHSDQLEFDGEFAFAAGDSARAAVRVAYLGTNRDGSNRHRIDLWNRGAGCADGCRLRVELQHRQGLWPLRAPDTRLLASASGFVLPEVLLGPSSLTVEALDLSWRRSQGAAAGRMVLAVGGFELPGDRRLAGRLAAEIGGPEDAQHGRIHDWVVSTGEHQYRIPEVSLRADDEQLDWWLPELDLQAPARFAAHALAAHESLGDWVEALDPRGSVHDLRGFLNFRAWRDEGLRGGYAARLDSVSIDAHKGVPTVGNASGRLYGAGRRLQLDLRGRDMRLAFPNLFEDAWELPYARGELQAWLGAGYFGLRGRELHTEIRGSRISGGFAVARPDERSGQRLTLAVDVDEMAVNDAKTFVPYRLSPGLAAWLDRGPRAGRLSDARVAFQGQFHTEPGELGRRLAITAQVREGRVRYHPDWPEVTEIAGEFALAGPEVRLRAEQARSAGADLAGSEVRVLGAAATVVVSLAAELDGGAALAFARESPLREWLGFVEPDWTSRGPLALGGELRVPLGAEPRAAYDGLHVQLQAELDGVALDLPGYRLALDDLDGSVRYRYPRDVAARSVTGRLFGRPVSISAATDVDGRISLGFTGDATPRALWELLAVDDPGFADGTFGYAAELAIAVAPEQVTELWVRSDLAGLALRLPAGYGKAAADAQPIDVSLRFLPDYRAVALSYRDAAAWLHFDQVPLRGGVGFATAPPEVDVTSELLRLRGSLAGFALAEVIPAQGGGTADGGGHLALPLPVRIEALGVDAIRLGDFAVRNALLNGVLDSDRLVLELQSDHVTGSLVREGSGPMAVALTDVWIPAGTDPDGAGDAAPGAVAAADPLSVDLIDGLPDARVRIDRLRLGDADYGSWQFVMGARDGALSLTDLTARVRGVDIAAPQGLVWDGVRNETRFDGGLHAGNLAEVLPLWGFAPSVETESASLTGHLVWPGSPAAVDPLGLVGKARAQAENGRFLEVESAGGDALRIFSLLNLSTVMKRMTLDFSDVFGRGVSFDELDAQLSLDRGVLRLDEPMEVEGTGSNFRITGNVDLNTRRLDNELIVTLPVSRSLPWYAAYVALANPLAGLGVFVGGQMLRKPLDQFSSAKYRIGGTVEDPVVRFVNVFDVSTRDPETRVPEQK